MKNTAIIIPARLGAERFPNKPLEKINNLQGMQITGRYCILPKLDWALGHHAAMLMKEAINTRNSAVKIWRNTVFGLVKNMT